MPGLSHKLVEYRLPIKEGYKPRKQPARRLNLELLLKIRERLKCCLKQNLLRYLDM